GVVLWDDLEVDVFGDVDEREVVSVDDVGEAVFFGGGDQRGGRLDGVPAAQLDNEAAHPDLGELGDVGAQPLGLVRQRDPGGEDELAAVQQVRDVGDLGDVDPADPVAEAVAARDDAGLPAADRFEPQDVVDSGQHPHENIRTGCQATSPVPLHDVSPCRSTGRALSKRAGS